MTYYDTVNLTGTNKTDYAVPLKMRIFKRVNILLLTHFNEEENRNAEIINKYLKNFEQLGVRINIQFLFYDKNNGVVNNKDLYADIKKYNSKFVLEELKDDEIISILLFDENSNNPSIDVYFNKDLSQDLYRLNIADEKFVDILNQIILIRMTKNEIKTNLADKKYIFNLLSVLHNKFFIYHKLLMESLDNLETFNKFVMNYESIKTFSIVKEKVYLFY
jgi:hypothetical protein